MIAQHRIKTTVNGTRWASVDGYAVTLTFDLLTPKSNQHICEPKYICDQNCVKFPSVVFVIWCFWDTQTHSLTSRTDRFKYSMPLAPFFNDGGDIINKRQQSRVIHTNYTLNTHYMFNHRVVTMTYAICLQLKAQLLPKFFCRGGQELLEYLNLNFKTSLKVKDHILLTT